MNKLNLTGRLVKLAGYPRRVWRVLSQDHAAGTVDLTAVNSFERLDYRDVDVQRVSISAGIIR